MERDWEERQGRERERGKGRRGWKRGRGEEREGERIWNTIALNTAIASDEHTRKLLLRSEVIYYCSLCQVTSPVLQVRLYWVQSDHSTQRESFPLCKTLHSLCPLETFHSFYFVVAIFNLRNFLLCLKYINHLYTTKMYCLYSCLGSIETYFSLLQNSSQISQIIVSTSIHFLNSKPVIPLLMLLYI